MSKNIFTKFVLAALVISVALSIPIGTALQNAEAKIKVEQGHSKQLRLEIDSLRREVQQEGVEQDNLLKQQEQLKQETDALKQVRSKREAEAKLASVQTVQREMEKPAVAVSGNAQIVMSTLKSIGVTHKAAAYLTGSFESESGLTPCGVWGDGGKAHGLNQWHPGRRADMPCDLVEQTKWAILVEMKRDSPGSYEVMFNPNATDNEIKAAIRKWTRWGVEGRRWEYALKYI